MSLDVTLTDESGNVVFDANITHNLNRMAEEAGIYKHVWRPEEIGITKAGELIEPLKAGVALLASEQTRFEEFNSPNGWGKWEHFVPWLCKYLNACRQHPHATVSVSR